MAGKIQKVTREVNGITVEQRSIDGFINGTAMCVAYKKEIAAWFRNQNTLDLFIRKRGKNPALQGGFTRANGVCQYALKIVLAF